METAIKYYQEKKKLLDEEFSSAALLLDSVSGQYVCQRLGWINWVFARACVLTNSLRMLVSAYDDKIINPSIDHASIAIIARAVLECEIMIGYLATEGLSDEEWELRKLVMHIHDCCSRVRLFKGLGIDKEYKGHKDQLSGLKLKLRQNTSFRKLSKDFQRELLSGNRVFVNGTRKVAMEIGWTDKEWDGVYNYLSTQAHSTPMSFYRYGQHGVNVSGTTSYQLSIAAFALEQAGSALCRTSKVVKRSFDK